MSTQVRGERGRKRQRMWTERPTGGETETDIEAETQRCIQKQK